MKQIAPSTIFAIKDFENIHVHAEFHTHELIFPQSSHFHKFHFLSTPINKKLHNNNSSIPNLNNWNHLDKLSTPL
jgi:hypothetical protein